MQKLNKSWIVLTQTMSRELKYVYAPYSWYYYFNISLLKFINKFTVKGLKIKVFKYLLQAFQWFIKFNYSNPGLNTLNYLLFNLFNHNNYAQIFKLVKKSNEKKTSYEYQKFLILAPQRRWSYIFYLKSLLSFYDINKLKLRFIYFFFDTFSTFNSSLFKQYLRIIK